MANTAKCVFNAVCRVYVLGLRIVITAPQKNLFGGLEAVHIWTFCLIGISYILLYTVNLLQTTRRFWECNRAHMLLICSEL